MNNFTEQYMNDITMEHHIRFSIYFLQDILENNDCNVKDKLFEESLAKFGNNISVCKNLDFYLHKKEFSDMKRKYDVSNLVVLTRKEFPLAKVGDIISGSLIVNVFTFTIWGEYCEEEEHVEISYNECKGCDDNCVCDYCKKLDIQFLA
jgi:hypothetical protein